MHFRFTHILLLKWFIISTKSNVCFVVNLFTFYFSCLNIWWMTKKLYFQMWQICDRVIYRGCVTFECKNVHNKSIVVERWQSYAILTVSDKNHAPIFVAYFSLFENRIMLKSLWVLIVLLNDLEIPKITCFPL